MNRTRRLILGIFTLWPTIYFVLLIISFIMTWNHIGSDDETTLITPEIWIISLLLTVLLTVILAIIYRLNINRNGSLNNKGKVIWINAIRFGSPISMLIYWYLYIWRQTRRPVKGCASISTEGKMEQ